MYGIFDTQGGFMAYSKPIEYLVAVYCDEEKAKKALIQLQDEKFNGLVIEEAAVLSKTEDGKISFHEPSDWGLGRGAALGAVVGGLAGILIGPGALFTGAIGAAIGGLAARLYDTGFNNNELKELSSFLKPNTSALLIAAQGDRLVELDRLLVEAGAEVVTDALQPELAEKMDADFDEFLSMLKASANEGDLVARSGLVIGQEITINKEQIEHQEIDPYKPRV
jgi:uncharacterized membrane protein